MKSTYLLGCAVIDAQHAYLINVLDDLHAKIGLHTLQVSDLEGVKEFVDTYVTTHFKDEEDLMRKYSYPNLGTHVKQHLWFADAMIKESSAPHDPLFEKAFDTLLGLNRWLRSHILVEDKAFVEYLREHAPEEFLEEPDSGHLQDPVEQ